MAIAPVRGEVRPATSRGAERARGLEATGSPRSRAPPAVMRRAGGLWQFASPILAGIAPFVKMASTLQDHRALVESIFGRVATFDAGRDTTNNVVGALASAEYRDF